MTNEELRESLLKLWDAHTALKVEYERHDSWTVTRWKEYDKKMFQIDKSIRDTLRDVGTLNIVTAVSKTKLGAMFVMSNAIGGGITLVIVWISRSLGGE